MNVEQHHAGPGQPHGVKQASEISPPRDRPGQCLGKAAGFSVITGESEASGVTRGLRPTWNSAEGFDTVKTEQGIYETH